MAPLLEVSKLRVKAGEHTLLHGIDLVLYAGEKVALLGPSGAGKTTLLHHIYKMLGNQCALCPQHLGLVDALSMYHNIYMGQLQHCPFYKNAWNLLFPLKKYWRRADQMRQQLELAPALNTSVAKLSGGERQRVAIARALFSEKPIFIGDEPIANLDPRLQQSVLEHILAQHNTAIVALHDPVIAYKKFNRLIGLKAGRVIFDSATRKLTLQEVQHFYRDTSG